VQRQYGGLVAKEFGCHYDRQKILDLYRFINWILALPEAVEREFWQELQVFIAFFPIQSSAIVWNGIDEFYICSSVKASKIMTISLKLCFLTSTQPTILVL
jgi:hypothetical protein